MKNKKRKIAAIYAAIILVFRLGIDFLVEKFNLGKRKNITESYSDYNPHYFTLDEEELSFDAEFDRDESQNTEINEKGLDLEYLLSQFGNVPDEKYLDKDSREQFDKSNILFTDDKNNFEEKNPNNKTKRKKS